MGRNYLEKVVGVSGWIKTTRYGGAKSFAFVKVNDGSTSTDLQLIVNSDVPGFEHLVDKTASIAASVFAIGKIVESSGKKELVLLYAFLIIID